MQRLKCRISLFCILFLVLFLAGTICGALLVRLICGAEPDWILAYSAVLTRQQTVCSFVRPVAVALVLGFAPWGRRLLVPLIVIRGLLLGYSVGFLLVSSQSVAPMVLRAAGMLPLFFAACLWSIRDFLYGKHVRFGL